MPRTTDDPKTQVVQMRVSRAFLRMVDAWRRQQPDKPQRSEAIRRMCEIASKGAE
jgi:hypothetical protein